MNNHSSHPLAATGSKRLVVLETLLVLAVFAVAGGWAPPDVNEPHYLGKARHYWDREWCAGDFFFDSADSHVAFYWGCGWLTLLFPLPAVAWIGRVAAWTALAAGWRRLSWRVAPQPGMAVISATLWVLLIDHFQAAGEWVFGGLEAKPFAYALVLFGLGDVAENRWRRAWLWLGAASALHVLVGGWATVAVAVGWMFAGPTRESIRSMIPGLVGGAGLSLVGVVPALALTWGADPELVDQANVIYVFERLKHHLVANQFKRWFVMRHCLLAIGFLILGGYGLRNERLKRARGATYGALAIALVGAILGLVFEGDEAAAAQWLRFYWFRMSDSLLPLGVALSVVAVAAPAIRWKPPNRRALWLAMIAALSAWHLVSLWQSQRQATAPRADRADKVANYRDWNDVCEWVRDHTPVGARCLTPRLAQTFKWRAERADVVSWKDVPQDAAGIVEWWRRLRDIHGVSGLPEEEVVWLKTLATSSPKRLRELGRRYEAQYLVCEADPPLSFPLLFRNTTYAVYDLR